MVRLSGQVGGPHSRISPRALERSGPALNIRVYYHILCLCVCAYRPWRAPLVKAHLTRRISLHLIFSVRWMHETVCACISLVTCFTLPSCKVFTENANHFSV